MTFPTTSDRPLPAEVSDRLRCPACGGGVAAVRGGLRCGRGHAMRWVGGVLDARVDGPAVDGSTASTMRSFGYEWTAFADVRPEDEAFWSRYTELLPLDELGHAVALDAGCGKGRFSLFTARHVAALVALDGSDAVEAAARNLAGTGAVVVRADVRRAPLGPGSIDLVTCLGVLHHLDDPRAGFDALARLVAPGGRFLLYVYSRPAGPGVRRLGLAAASALRRITVRLPHRVVRVVAAPVAAGLYLAVVVPGALGARRRWRRAAALPLATYRGAPLRSLWLDTFDRLSAPVEHRHTADEVERWFADAGLAVVGVRDQPDLAGLVVLGRRPPGGGVGGGSDR